jgi:hypothetical protein
MSSYPLSVRLEGDLNVLIGSDTTQFGWGDADIARNVIVRGTGESVGTTSGSLVVYGGFGLQKVANLQSQLYVIYDSTYLATTFINTNLGPTTVSGGNAVNIQVGAASNFITTGGNLTLQALNDTTLIYAGLNSENAITLNNTHLDGGINLLSGSGLGKIKLTSGSGGINGVTSSGNVSLIANNNTGDFTVNSQSASQNLTFSLSGMTDSKLRIESSGTNVTNTAIEICTTNTAGNIEICTAEGLGSGSINLYPGSGGLHVTTNTGGEIALTSNGAKTSINVDSNGPNQNLELNLNGASSGILLTSSGVSNAIVLSSTSATGNIVTTQTEGSGKVSTFTGTGGFQVTTLTGGPLSITTYSATANLVNNTSLAAQDLTLRVLGNTDSSIILNSEGNGADAIRIETTTNSGGILLQGQGQVQVQSTNLVNGVKIATTASGVPVTIGTANSTTTINGDLTVKGTTTTVHSTEVTIDDNIIIVNNAPSMISDGGIGIKRYQPATDSSSGEVILDSPTETGTVSSSGNTFTTINLGPAANANLDYYNGWWIRLSTGTGAGQTRRIKTYDNTTNIATLYADSDQTTQQPIEGLDLITVPDATTEYQLFVCYYKFMIWDETNNEFAFTCSPTNTVEQPNLHYSNVHLNNLTANNINVTTINNLIVDTTTTVTLTNNSTLPVTITGFPATYGVFSILVRPQSITTRAYATFQLARINSATSTGVVHRYLSAGGTSGDKLDVQWGANVKPELFFRPAPGGGGTTTFVIRITTV